MPTEVIMPKVDMDMATGKVALWHVGEGDRVEKGTLILEIETAKAAMEVEAPASGIIRHLSAAGDSEIAVGTAIAFIYAEGEAILPTGATTTSAAADDAAAGTAQTAHGPDAAGNGDDPTGPGVAGSAPAVFAATADGSGKIRATPAARSIARESGFDLSVIRGSGPLGRVARADVEAHAAAVGTGARTYAGPRIEPQPKLSPIVLIHGLAADATGWLPLMKQLPKSHPVIRLELPHHGRGPRVPVESFEGLVDAMMAELDRLALPPCHLVGHSLGGAVALGLAKRRPDSTRSLALIAPALGPEIDLATVTGILRADNMAELAPGLGKLAAPGLIDDNYVRSVLAVRPDADQRRRQIKLAHAVFPGGRPATDLGAGLAGLTIPCRLIWGRNDAIIPWQHALTAPGHAALNLLPETGHLPHLEQPRLVAMVLIELFAAAEHR